MGVVALQPVQIIPFQYEHPDLRRPTGAWYGIRADVPGDASGGAVDIEFQFPAKWVQTHVASLEAAALKSTAALSAYLSINSWMINIAGVGNPVYTRQLGSTNAPASGDGESFSVYPHNGISHYIIHGVPITPAVAGDLTTVILWGANVNLALFTARCWGFWWEVKRGNI